MVVLRRGLGLPEGDPCTRRANIQQVLGALPVRVLQWVDGQALALVPVARQVPVAHQELCRLQASSVRRAVRSNVAAARSATKNPKKAR